MGIEGGVNGSSGSSFSVEEEEARILSVKAEREISLGHRLSVNFHRVDSRNGYSPMSPLFVRLSEEEGEFRHEDVFIFDAGGKLLSHTYSDYRGDMAVAEKESDYSLERLKKNSRVISNVLRSSCLPYVFTKHPIVDDLLADSLQTR